MILMKDKINLARVSLKSADVKKKPMKILYIFAAAFAILCSAFAIYKVSALLYTHFANIGVPDAMLEYSMIIAVGIAVAFSLVTVVDVLYLSKDSEKYMSLPFEKGSLIAGKYIAICTLQYATLLISLIPVIYFGMKENVGFLFYISAIVIYLFMPVVTIFITSIVIMLVMKLFKSVNGMLYNILSILFLFAIAVVVLAIGYKVGVSPEGRIAALLLNHLDLLGILGRCIMPGLIFASRALALAGKISGLIYLLLFILSTIIEFLLLILITNILNKKKEQKEKN